jgi:hypothetical protein
VKVVKGSSEAGIFGWVAGVGALRRLVPVSLTSPDSPAPDRIGRNAKGTRREGAARQPQPNYHHEGQKSTKENHPDGPIQNFVFLRPFVVRKFSQE